MKTASDSLAVTSKLALARVSEGEIDQVSFQAHFARRSAVRRAARRRPIAAPRSPTIRPAGRYFAAVLPSARDSLNRRSAAARTFVAPCVAPVPRPATILIGETQVGQAHADARDLAGPAAAMRYPRDLRRSAHPGAMRGRGNTFARSISLCASEGHRAPRLRSPARSPIPLAKARDTAPGVHVRPENRDRAVKLGVRAIPRVQSNFASSRLPCGASSASSPRRSGGRGRNSRQLHAAGPSFDQVGGQRAARHKRGPAGGLVARLEAVLFIASAFGRASASRARRTRSRHGLAAEHAAAHIRDLQRGQVAAAAAQTFDSATSAVACESFPPCQRRPEPQFALAAAHIGPDSPSQGRQPARSV